MKSRLLLSAALLCSFSAAMAQSFEVDGNTYTPTGENTAEFTKYGSSESAFTIPSTVTNDGKEYTVTSIGDEAFELKTSVSSVTMPSTITKIGKSAFYFCGAGSITMSENIDSIMENAFYFTNWYLKSMENFPEHLKYVGAKAFNGVSALKSALYLEEGVVLADDAFSGTGITEVNILGAPGSIGEGALDLEDLQTVNCHLTTPPSFDPEAAFVGDYSDLDLKNVTLNVPVGAKSTYQADANWSKFGTINEVDFAAGEKPENPYEHFVVSNNTAGSLDSNLPSASDIAKIKTLVISGDLNGDDISTLREMTLDSLDINDARIVAGGGAYLVNQLGEYYTSNDTIGQYMFMNSQYGYIKMPKGVKYIADDAFNSASLKTAVMGDEITALGSMVFGECTALDSIRLSSKLEDLGDFTFATDRSLKHITFPATLKKIGDDAFYFCNSLDNIVLPDGLEELGGQAFFDCESLSSIYIPKNLTEIGLGAFDRCYKLAAFNVDEANTAWKSVDGVLFTKDGTVLERYPVGKADAEYTIPDGTKGIETNAFWETKAKNIVMSDDVTVMGNGAFEMTDSLETITLSKNLTSIGIQAFFSDSKLKAIDIPASVTEIGRGAFMSCTAITEAAVPEGVDTLEEDIFWGCEGLKKVTLPSTLTGLGEAVFYNCHSLDTVVVNAVTPPTCVAEDRATFSEVTTSNVKLIVPYEAVEAYKAAEVWKDFDIEGDATGIHAITSGTENNAVEAIYSVSGERLSTPAKGLNIIRYADGRTVKVLIK